MADAPVSERTLPHNLEAEQALLGAILVNINPAYRTHEVSYALTQSGCRLLLAAQAFKTSDYVAMVAEVRPAEDPPAS